MNTNWKYVGDLNLKYGGMYIRLESDYADIVRVTDLDSGCGFTGAVMIEHLTTFDFDNPKKMASAGECCGVDLFNSDTLTRAICFVEYGYSDPDDGWANYREYHTEVLQTERGEPMEFDGWKADKFIENLEAYVESHHLR